MAALYADENFPLPVVERLRALGHDVLTSVEAGKANQQTPDDEVLTFAAGMGRALLTLNRRDFIRLHRAGAAHAGIIACTFDADYATQANRIDAELGKTTTLHGQLFKVNRPAPP